MFENIIDEMELKKLISSQQSPTIVVDEFDMMSDTFENCRVPYHNISSEKKVTLEEFREFYN